MLWVRAPPPTPAIAPKSLNWRKLGFQRNLEAKKENLKKVCLDEAYLWAYV